MIWLLVLVSGLVFGFVADSSVKAVDSLRGCSVAYSVYR